MDKTSSRYVIQNDLNHRYLESYSAGVVNQTEISETAMIFTDIRKAKNVFKEIQFNENIWKIQQLGYYDV